MNQAVMERAELTNRQVDDLVESYLSHITDPRNDGAWRGDSPCSRIGEGSGPINALSNESMINAISRLTDAPKGFSQVARLIHRAVHGGDREKHSHQVLALLAKFYYRGLFFDAKSIQRPYDDEERGRRIGQTLAQYRFNVKAGYRYFRRRM